VHNINVNSVMSDIIGRREASWGIGCSKMLAYSTCCCCWGFRNRLPPYMWHIPTTEHVTLRGIIFSLRYVHVWDVNFRSRLLVHCCRLTRASLMKNVNMSTTRRGVGSLTPMQLVVFLSHHSSSVKKWFIFSEIAEFW